MEDKYVNVVSFLKKYSTLSSSVLCFDLYEEVTQTNLIQMFPLKRVFSTVTILDC